MGTIISLMNSVWGILYRDDAVSEDLQSDIMICQSEIKISCGLSQDIGPSLLVSL